MVNKSIIKITKKFISEIPDDINVKKVYLFGSYAKGNENKNSDIDIAIIIKDMTNFFDIQMQLMRLRRKIDLRIEPHPINESDFTNINPFAYEIEKSGIEISV
jgi:predicted nucleotidyltransferase